MIHFYSPQGLWLCISLHNNTNVVKHMQNTLNTLNLRVSHSKYFKGHQSL